MWLITFACPAVPLMHQSHTQCDSSNKFCLPPSVACGNSTWIIATVSKAFIMSIQCLPCDLSHHLEHYLCLTTVTAAQIPFPFIPWTPIPLTPMCACVLPHRLNACQVSDAVILQERRGSSDVHPLATGWLWKRSCIQQWKEALLSSLFQCGCVEL